MRQFSHHLGSNRLDDWISLLGQGAACEIDHVTGAGCRLYVQAKKHKQTSHIGTNERNIAKGRNVVLCLSKTLPSEGNEDEEFPHHRVLHLALPVVLWPRSKQCGLWRKLQETGLQPADLQPIVQLHVCITRQASPRSLCQCITAVWQRRDGAGRRGWQLRVAVLSSSKDSPWNKCSEEGRSWTRWGFHNGEKMSRTALWLREAIGPSSSLSSLHPSRSRGDLPVNDADVRDESTEVISVDLHRRNGGRNCKRSCQAGTEHRHTVSVS